ncbi:MAG: DUF1642 domain-containing protein [Loigolactobacillus coryniformis]|uniref:DUF1642 domain-containing protein n=1 Tax=Loigolactobacillus coryniformis TaxID=1610 RepID=UPI00264896C7|nr:DUF1642 domain-containing protein [Loigolactobacillus coryniformis]MDN5950947.1 DUF1642 domain-containing protein [Loigolactobacillus coryniformis]MDN5954238.1 DUF1642 domain-containing protein [Loigolactobacillus coryniformis]
MSEEKLYAVKNDEGKYLDSTSFWNDNAGIAFKSSDIMLEWAKIFDGHVVTLIEEPEKVVLSKEQAEIVENAHDEEFPATYISDSANLAASGEEKLLINAYASGYTVEKDKKYLVQDIFSHEVIATFDTYDEADNFLDAAYDMPDWWTIPAMTIVEVTDNEQ